MGAPTKLAGFFSMLLEKQKRPSEALPKAA
jgi:hypothetical protein